jgi:hypothetical protein
MTMSDNLWSRSRTLSSIVIEGAGPVAVFSVPEMPPAGEDHREAVLVRRRDHFRIAH